MDGAGRDTQLLRFPSKSTVDATKAETEYTSVHRETDRDIFTQVETAEIETWRDICTQVETAEIETWRDICSQIDKTQTETESSVSKTDTKGVQNSCSERTQPKTRDIC